MMRHPRQSEGLEQSKTKITELIGINSMPPISYKFWDKEDKTMGNVKYLRYNSDGNLITVEIHHGESEVLKWPSDGVIIPSTGLYDNAKDQLYMGDIVKCYFLDTMYKDRVVFWDNGWRVIGCTTEEFRDNCEQFVSQLGNIWEDENMYKTYQDRFKDSLK